MHICLASWGDWARKAVAVYPVSLKKPLHQGIATPLTVEVLDLEDTGTRLGGSALELGGVDLSEAETVEVLAEDVADTRLDAEDGLVGGGTEVHDTVVKTGGERDTRVLLALGLTTLNLGLGTRSVLDGEGKGLRLDSGEELEIRVSQNPHDFQNICLLTLWMEISYCWMVHDLTSAFLISPSTTTMDSAGIPCEYLTICLETWWTSASFETAMTPWRVSVCWRNWRKAILAAGDSVSPCTFPVHTRACSCSLTLGTHVVETGAEENLLANVGVGNVLKLEPLAA